MRLLIYYMSLDSIRKEFFSGNSSGGVNSDADNMIVKTIHYNLPV